LEALADSGCDVGAWLFSNTLFVHSFFEYTHLINLPVVIPSTIAAFQSTS